jgi:hypothetical protein
MANQRWPARPCLAMWLTSIAVASAASTSLPQAIAQESERSQMHRVLLIPVNLRGRAAVAVDRKQIMQALYGADNSVASRYRAISFGKVQFAGSDSDLADPITLSEPPDFCGSGLGLLAAEVEEELQRRGIRHAAYQHIAFIIPKEAPCWWTGVGDIRGNRVWVKATTVKALQHELGHNLGMNHALDWQSSNPDSSDFMGSGGAGLNAPHVVEMGWLQSYPAKVIELTKPGDVTLEVLEADPTQSVLPKVAIVRPAPGANVYYLSYRASNSADPLTDEFTRGLNIHIVDAARQIGGLTYFVTSLSDGAAYHDGPMIVQQLSHSEGDHVTFRISFAGTGQAMSAGPPPAPPGTVQSLASGKCLDLPGGQTRDGTPAIQYDCHGGPNQQWRVDYAGDAGYRIISRMSGKCLGMDPDAIAGGPIVQSQCRSSPDQLWALKGAGNELAFQNVANQLCLDLPGASLDNSVKLIAWVCNGGVNQTWRYRSATAP